jgi:hypothetical protein
MFINYVEFWLQGHDEHVVKYIQRMLDNGHTTLTDFQSERNVLTEQMALCNPKFTTEFQYMWSIRDWIDECLRWYVPE